MRSIFLLTALAWAASLPAHVISPPPITPTAPAPVIPELKQYLNLTDAQVTSLESIVQQKSQALQQVSDQIAQKNQTLQTLLASPNPNPTTVGQTMIDIQNLGKQLTPSTEPYHTEAVAVLTQSQLSLLGNLNTALQLQTPACEAVNVNLLVPASSQPTAVSGSTTGSTVATAVCGVVPVPLGIAIGGGTLTPGVIGPVLPPGE